MTRINFTFTLVMLLVSLGSILIIAGLIFRTHILDTNPLIYGNVLNIFAMYRPLILKINPEK